MSGVSRLGRTKTIQQIKTATQLCIIIYHIIPYCIVLYHTFIVSVVRIVGSIHGAVVLRHHTGVVEGCSVVALCRDLERVPLSVFRCIVLFLARSRIDS